MIFVREKNLCCECKHFRYGTNTILSNPTCSYFGDYCLKGESPCADRQAKGYCKYFEVEEE